MDDFCNCSQCPNHCGGDEEEIIEKENTAVPAAPDDSAETSDEKDAEAMAVKKVEKLKKAIRALGFKLKDTEEGIRVMM